MNPALFFLKKRAQLINDIRHFFAERNVLEVTTPLLSRSTNTDVYIESFQTSCYSPIEKKSQTFYLQTSPEFHLKRLLAAGSGSIFQICQAFRIDEIGKLHNPEFTMLEWYRVGFDHFQLMDEMDLLLQKILLCKKAQRMSYADVFQYYLDIDPHRATIAELQQCLKQHDIVGVTEGDKDTFLNLLITHVIEPQLGFEEPVFIYDYPASQSALAKIRHDDPPVAERFEVYVKGIELANGYHELTDAHEQRKRMEDDNQKRQEKNLAQIPLDENFLEALKSGMPNCAGVALGIDRLIMLALGVSSISEVMSFDWANT